MIDLRDTPVLCGEDAEKFIEILKKNERNLGMKYKNKIKCKLCGDVIESKSRHDFKQCTCCSVFVDGGLDYRRIGWPGEMEYEDCVEVIYELI